MMSDAQSDDPEEGWRQDGRCGACVYFKVDFGDPPVLFGHCKMYGRTGARESSAFACLEYEPLEGFAALTRSTTQPPPATPPSSGRRAGAARRRGVVRHGGGVVVRRPSGDRDRAVARPRDIVDDSVGLDMFDRAVQGTLGEGEETVDRDSLRDVLVDVIENFLSIEDVELGTKWEGGLMTLQPADPDLKPLEMPVEAFFHKIVMVRDRLRVLEQKLNTHEGLSATDKAQVQQYISRCYGSLTTFNVLFKNRGERFSSKS